LVALNLGPDSVSVPLPGPGTVLVSTDLGRDGEPVGGLLSLGAHEGAAIDLGHG
jgi:hypothetical protein